MTGQLKPRTLVIVAGQLGEIVRASKRGNAIGYDVLVGPETNREGTAPGFAPGWTVQRAELGVNVCKAARGQCLCGLVHIAHPEWLS
jgi:hypothetical protein